MGDNETSTSRSIAIKDALHLSNDVTCVLTAVELVQTAQSMQDCNMMNALNTFPLESS